MTSRPSDAPHSRTCSQAFPSESFHLFQHNCCGSNNVFLFICSIVRSRSPPSWLYRILSLLMVAPHMHLVLFLYLIQMYWYLELFFICRLILRQMWFFDCNCFLLPTCWVSQLGLMTPKSKYLTFTTCHGNAS